MVAVVIAVPESEQVVYLTELEFGVCTKEKEITPLTPDVDSVPSALATWKLVALVELQVGVLPNVLAQSCTDICLFVPDPILKKTVPWISTESVELTSVADGVAGWLPI